MRLVPSEISWLLAIRDSQSQALTLSTPWTAAGDPPPKPLQESYLFMARTCAIGFGSLSARGDLQPSATSADVILGIDMLELSAGLHRVRCVEKHGWGGSGAYAGSCPPRCLP